MDQRDDFDEMTQYLSHEARWFVLDAMACAFHNHGYHLTGNTEQNDARWLANALSQDLDFRGLEQASVPRQEELIQIAAVAIRCLPALTDRIASRYIRMSKAIRTTERLAAEQAKQMQEEKRQGRREQDGGGDGADAREST